MAKRKLIGWKGICSNEGKFVPADEEFTYICEQVGIMAFDYDAPEAEEFVASTVEWYFSGNWIEVYEEDDL